MVISEFRLIWKCGKYLNLFYKYKNNCGIWIKCGDENGYIRIWLKLCQPIIFGCMLAYLGKYIMICQLFNQKIWHKVDMFYVVFMGFRLLYDSYLAFLMQIFPLWVNISNCVLNIKSLCNDLQRPKCKMNFLHIGCRIASRLTKYNSI
jgi:hypothetical protein